MELVGKRLSWFARAKKDWREVARSWWPEPELVDFFYELANHIGFRADPPKRTIV